MRVLQPVLPAAVILLLLACGSFAAYGAGVISGKVVEMQLTSPVLAEGERMPLLYTCDGEDISPPLTWSKVPRGTESFAMIYTNHKGWTFWLLYNIPPEVRELPEALPPDRVLANGSIQGINDEQWHRYVGPCPPFSQESIFIIYALDTLLELGEKDNRARFNEAVSGHVLGRGELRVKYARKMY
jgi:Raf kinase inhibitor-like YbhB/YbcL family protein